MGHSGRRRLSVITSTRYQLFVVASDVGVLVAAAGGWICDRIHAGWDVSVAVTEPHDLRPLQILGITTVVTDQGIESISDRREIAAIAFATDTLDRDQLLCSQVLKVLDQGATEVTVWGESLPGPLEGRVHPLKHRLSFTSRAFKAHAVAAARFPISDIGDTEEFYGSAPCCDASVNKLRADA